MLAGTEELNEIAGIAGTAVQAMMGDAAACEQLDVKLQATLAEQQPISVTAEQKRDAVGEMVRRVLPCVQQLLAHPVIAATLTEAQQTAAGPDQLLQLLLPQLNLLVPQIAQSTVAQFSGIDLKSMSDVFTGFYRESGSVASMIATLRPMADEAFEEAFDAAPISLGASASLPLPTPVQPLPTDAQPTVIDWQGMLEQAMQEQTANSQPDDSVGTDAQSATAAPQDVEEQASSQPPTSPRDPMGPD